jgi:hypothetical protein
VCSHWLWHVSQGPGRYAGNDEYLNICSTEINPATSNGNLPTGSLECGWAARGGKGRMERQWSSEWRAVAMNCKENEVVVCDGKGPCSGISICAVDAGSGH